MIEFGIEDKFIVSGASSGIGRGIALLLNSLGATVIGIGRNIDALNSLKESSKYPDNMHLEVKNLTENIELLPEYIKGLKDKYGKFKGMVCSAGMDMPAILRSIKFEESKSVFDINYFVPVFMAKGFADKRIYNGNNSSIVFIASSAGVYPDKGQVIYAATKAALIASAKSMSKELSSVGLRVNSVSPAEIDTPMSQRNFQNIGQHISNYPFGIGNPDDVASLVAFLLSDKAKWITGQNYVLDGGAF